MNLTTNITIEATQNQVWSVITNIKEAPHMISGIKSVTILNSPEQGVVGLKWEETRTMMGKDAVETMWITDAQTNQFYQTRAENCGAVYISRFDITPLENSKSVLLTMSFKGESSRFLGKLMTLIMGKLMKKSLLKMVEQDLKDIKAFVESKH